eukprot:403332508
MKIIREILNHALEFNNKYKVEDLNLLDVLNSYDELIKNYNVNKEQGQKIYRRLLQMQRQNSDNQSDKNKETSNSKSSSLNQDLQFDFLGSFGNLKASNRHRSQSQMKSSYSISDQKVSEMQQNMTRNAVEPPSVMNSQFQSIAGAKPNYELFQSNLSFDRSQQKSIDGFPPHNINNHQVSLFDSKIYGNHQSSMNSAFSTLNMNALASQQNTQRDTKTGVIPNTIKLPKLSFNDLIQAQNYDSFKKLNEQQQHIIREESTGELTQSLLMREQVEYININYEERYDPYNNEEEELKSQEMSVFRSNKKLQDNTNMINDSSLMRYSNNKQSTYFQQDSQQTDFIQKNDEYKIVSKFPKLKLITESELQSIDKNIQNLENQILNYPSSQKENQQCLSNRGERRPQSRSKSKNRTNNNQHEDFKTVSSKSNQETAAQILEFLANCKNAYNQQGAFKQVIQVILKKEDTFEILSALETFCEAYLTSRKKTEEGSLILYYQAQIQSSVSSKTKSRKATRIKSQITVNQACFKIIKVKICIWVTSPSCYQLINKKDLKIYRSSYKLSETQNQGIQSTIDSHQFEKKAKAYAHENQNKAYQVLRQFAIHNRKNKLAYQHQKYWLQYRFFKSFKFNTYLKRGAKTQNEFLQRYHNHSLLLKSMKSLIVNAQEQKDRNFLVLSYLTRTRVRKIFRALYWHKSHNQVNSVPQNGAFINCARLLLENSFSKVMESVWKEFPKQKQTINKITQKENSLLNYIGLSKNQRYRSFFYHANENLRKYQLYKLKQNHLDILCQKFQANITRKRYLRLWYQQLQKITYLQEQELQINSHQTNLVLYKCYQKLKQYVQDKQRTKLQTQAADQEYRYWLGRRTISMWKIGLNNMNSQVRLYEYLDQEKSSKIIRKVYDGLRLFKQFQQNRQLNDQLITNAIRGLMKDRIFKNWRSKINKKYSCNLIRSTFDKAEKRLAIQRFMHVISWQDSVIEVMNQKREAYLVLQHFNSLKKNNQQNSYHQHLNQYLKNRELLSQTKLHFNNWRNLYKQRKRTYVTYAFTVLQLKNQFLKRVLNDWKQYVGYLKMKKNGSKYQIQTVKQKVWRVEFLTEKWLQARYLQHENKRKKQIFDRILNYKIVKQTQKLELQEKKEFLEKAYQSFYFNKLRSIVQHRVTLKQKLSKGSQFNEQYMFRRSYIAWAQFYSQNKSQIRIQVKIKRNNQKHTLNKFMKLWLQKADKPIEKQTNFLITLCDRSDQFQKVRQFREKQSAITKLLDFTNKRQVYRQRNNDIIDYYRKKLLIRGSVALVKYLEHRKQQATNRDLAFLQYTKWIKKNSFKSFRQITVQQHLLKQAYEIMIHSQKLIYGQTVLAQLNINKLERQNYNTKKFYSTNYRISRQVQKAFRCLQQNKLRQRIKQELTSQAHAQYSINLVQKSLNVLRLFKNQNQLQKHKRGILYQVIYSMDQEIYKRAVLKVFNVNNIIEKDERFQNDRVLRFLKLSRLFQSMRFNYNTKKDLRGAFQQVSQQNHTTILKKNALIGLLQNIQIIKYLEEQQQQRIQNNIAIHYQAWKQAFINRLQFKQKMIDLFVKFEQLDKQQCFRQWKRGAFFMKTCELIYTHRYQEEEENTLASCFKEWRRYQIHQQKKVQQYHALRENHFYHQKRQSLKTWINQDQVKCQIFAMKMEKLVKPRYCDSIEAMFRYAFKDQELENRVKRFENRIQKQTRRQFFYEWMIRFQQKEQFDIIQHQLKQRLMKKVMKAFEIYRLQKIQDKYQMLKVIQFYSQRRPELLLCFSKTFLCLNNQYASTISSIEDRQPQARMCSTALAKYIFEKWKNVKDVLQVDNDMKRQADEFYVYRLARKFITEWREAVTVINYKRSLKLSCQEFNYVNLMKKALQGFKINMQKNAYQYHLQQYQHEVLKIKSESLFVKYFELWRNKFLDNQKIRTVEIEISDKLKQNLLSKLKKQGVNQAAYNHFNAKIITKYFILFKNTIMEQNHKNKHSKLFSIFVAWKFYVKENKLVQKYLSECNYQTSHNQRKGSREPSQQQKRSISQQKENFESLNDSSYEMKQYRMDRYNQASNLGSNTQQDFHSIQSNGIGSNNILNEKTDSFFNQLSVGMNNRTRQNPLGQQNSKLFTPTLGSNNNPSSHVNQNQDTQKMRGQVNGVFGSSFFKNNFESLVSEGSSGSQGKGRSNSREVTQQLKIFNQRFYNQQQN